MLLIDCFNVSKILCLLNSFLQVFQVLFSRIALFWNLLGFQKLSYEFLISSTRRVLRIFRIHPASLLLRSPILLPSRRFHQLLDCGLPIRCNGRYFWPFELLYRLVGYNKRNSISGLSSVRFHCRAAHLRPIAIPLKELIGLCSILKQLDDHIKSLIASRHPLFRLTWIIITFSGCLSCTRYRFTGWAVDIVEI